MSDVTKIEWTDHTWNPWEGCTKVSPGCAHCYAEARNHRFGNDNWGKGKPRRRTVDWRGPAKWDRSAALSRTRPRVFLSLCDWLDDEVPIEWLADFLKLLYETPNLDWLLLTKRPENFEARLMAAADHLAQENAMFEVANWIALWLRPSAEDCEDGVAPVKPPHNVWLGVSVENQEWADQRIPELLKIPARVRFLSVEPMLGMVELSGGLEWIDRKACGLEHDPLAASLLQSAVDEGRGDAPRLLHWVIFGGESGPGARPCNVEWIRDGMRQCRDAGVACFVKQLGKLPFDGSKMSHDSDRTYLKLRHRKGGEPAEWPVDLRVREFPNVCTQ